MQFRQWFKTNEEQRIEPFLGSDTHERIEPFLGSDTHDGTVVIHWGNMLYVYDCGNTPVSEIKYKYKKKKIKTKDGKIITVGGPFYCWNYVKKHCTLLIKKNKITGEEEWVPKEQESPDPEPMREKTPTQRIFPFMGK